MTIVPSLNYEKVISALRRDGWVVVRQKGSHIRLQKRTRNETLKLTVAGPSPSEKIGLGAYPETGTAEYRCISGVTLICAIRKGEGVKQVNNVPSSIGTSTRKRSSHRKTDKRKTFQV